MDPLDSTSRVLNAEVLGEEHYTVAREVQRILQKDIKTYRISLLFLVWTSYQKTIKFWLVVLVRLKNSYLNHSSLAEVFTGSPGKYVKLADTVRSFKDLISGKYDDLPEQAFYMVGSIDEVVEKAKS